MDHTTMRNEIRAVVVPGLVLGLVWGSGWRGLTREPAKSEWHGLVIVCHS